MTKKCSKCKINKSINDFFKKKKNKDGLNVWCKNCCKEYMKYYINNNREKIKEITDKRNKKYYNNNKEKIIENTKKYYYENLDECRKSRKKYIDNNKSIRKKCWGNWFSKSKNRLSSNISKAILYSLKGKKNKNHWEDLVGYTLKDLINHLQNTSSYLIEDYTNNKLHLDHIIPTSAYNFSNCEDDEFKKCWNLRNLRLIPAKDNLSKNDKLDLELIKKYSIEDLLPKNV